MKQQGFRRLWVWVTAQPSRVKTQLLLPTVVLFVVATGNTFAQIPNKGFENWGTFNGFDTPTGWTGIIGRGDHDYSIQKNPDNYPPGTGSFSIRIASDTGKGIFGFAKTDSLRYLAPGFAITGKLKSLTGYYKFLPQDGDTLAISVVLWQSGTMAAYATFSNHATVSSWTSFNLPIPDYTTADSAGIFLSSCSFVGGVPNPHGKSVLYIDNLNFDFLITPVMSEVKEMPRNFRLDQNYPNPFNPATTISFSIPSKALVLLKVFDALGREVSILKFAELSAGTYSERWNAEGLPSGVYFYRIQAGEFTQTKKLTLMQ